jgi:hypothetical protein
MLEARLMARLETRQGVKLDARLIFIANKIRRKERKRKNEKRGGQESPYIYVVQAYMAKLQLND